MTPDPSDRNGAHRARARRLVLLALIVVVIGVVAALVVWVDRREADPREAGTRLLAAGDARAAIPPLLRAVTLRPDDPLAHYRLGLAYARIGWHTAALQQFGTAAQLAPDSAEFRAALGCAYRDVGDTQAAVKELEAAARLAPAAAAPLAPDPCTPLTKATPTLPTK